MRSVRPFVMSKFIAHGLISILVMLGIMLGIGFDQTLYPSPVLAEVSAPRHITRASSPKSAQPWLAQAQNPVPDAVPDDSALENARPGKKAGIENSGVENSGVENSGVENPGVENPGVENPDIENPDDASQASPSEPSSGETTYIRKENSTVKPTVAPVTLDGQELFEVTAYKDLSARERADNVTKMLEQWATQRRVPTVTVEEGRGTTTIFLAGNDGYKEDLITVTKTDSMGDLRSPQVQAETWATKIEQALIKARAERNPRFLRQSIILATLAFITTCIGFWYLGRLQQQVPSNPLKQLTQLLQGQVKRDGIPIHVRQVAFALCLKVLRLGIWIAVIFYITQLFPATRQRSYELTTRVLGSFTTPLFPLGGKSYSLIDLLILVAGFLLLVVGSTLITNLLRTRILQLAGIGSGAQQAIATLIRYSLIALGTVVILQLWGLDLSSLTIIASALGVGIGFGLQNIARDFGSGLILLFERPIQVGDFIEVGTFKGTVDRIGARSTMVKTLDQVSVIVPNSYFLDNQVVNWSHDNPLSRIAIPVGVSYDANPEKVKSLLLQAGTAHKGVLQIPAPQVLFKGFGDNALDFELLVWIVEPNRQPLIRSDLYFSLFNLLQENGIEIPYPQRDLHIRTGSAAALTDASIRSDRSFMSDISDSPQRLTGD